MDFGIDSGIKSKGKLPMVRLLIERPEYRKLDPMQFRLNGVLSKVDALLGAYADRHLENVANIVVDGDAEKSAAKALISHIAEDTSWFSTIIEASDKKRPGAEITLARFLEQAFADIPEFRHPDFSWMSFKDESGIMVEYHDPRAQVDPSMSSQLFAVVREARGWAVEKGHEHEMNLLVRDLFWIAPAEEARGEEREGYYYSTYDASLYRVELRFDQNGDTADRNGYADAVVVKAQNHTNRFRLVFPLAPHRNSAIDFRQGIISGTGRTASQLAAWRAILIDPSSEWPESRRFQGLMEFFYRGGHHQMIASIITEAGYCGVMHGSKLSDASGQSHRNRESFRSLATLAVSGDAVQESIQGFLSAEIREGLAELVDVVTASDSFRPQDAPELAEFLFETFEAIVQRRRHLFEPMQIINFDPGAIPDERGQIVRRHLQQLLTPITDRQSGL